jgi:hypothetical protein
MTTSNSTILPQKPSSTAYTARATAANVSYSGNTTSGLALLYSAPTAANGGSGSVMVRLRARPAYASGSTTFVLTQAQLFKVDPNGNVIFDDDAAIPAQSLATTGGTAAPTSPADFGYTETSKRYLPPGWSWYVGISAAWSPGVTFSGDILDY